MAVTREQARRLLTDAEMTLFGESRNPALRVFSARELVRRVERTRKLRDKARDLLQRQQLSTRARTGSKRGTSGAANDRTARKGEVLEDILQRFQGRLEVVQEIDEKTGAAASSRVNAGAKARKVKAKDGNAKVGRTATRQSTPATKRKTTAAGTAPAQARTSGVRAVAVRKASAVDSDKARITRTSTAKSKPAGGQSAVKGLARKAVAAAAAAAPKSKRARKSAITPAQALSNTLALLEAKQQRSRTPSAYQNLDAHGEHAQPGPGYQSATANAKELELHAGEIRLDPIHGSISTRDRKNQGKRDHR